MQHISKYTSYLIIGIIVVITGIRLFFHLENVEIIDVDEAWHAVNAYEMVHNNNWLVNTYMGTAEYYNSKPPMGLWILALSYKLFGINFFAEKLPSSIFGLATLILLVVFLIKEFSPRAAAMFSAAFLTLNLLFDYHMYRTGNFDAFYCLVFSIAIIALYYARKNSNWIYLFGVCAGLGFMTKGLHVGIMVIVAICSYPFLQKQGRLKKTLISVLIAALIVLPWAVMRFMYDGLTFFKAMFTEEGALDQAVWFKTGYFKEIMSQKTFLIFMFAVVLYIVLKLIREKDFKKTISAIGNDLKSDAIFWIWLIVPVLFLSVTGEYNIWYAYPSVIAEVVLVGICFDRAFDESEIRWLELGVLCLIAAISVAQAIPRLMTYSRYLNDVSGSLVREFQGDIRTIVSEVSDEYRGQDIYIQQLTRNEPVSEIDFFQGDLIAYALIEGDLQCKEGGVTAWLEADDGILAVQKDLWEQYSAVLTGYVIIRDGGYLYFIHDRY